MKWGSEKVGLTAVTLHTYSPMKMEQCVPKH
jgi:hypothetical protein